MFWSDRENKPTENWSSFEREALVHQLDLYRIARWLLGDSAQAEDLVQETFVEALKSFHRFEKGTNCRAWLIKILYHVLSKQRRSAARLQLVSEEDEVLAASVTYTAPIPQGITEVDVLDALKRVPAKFQEVVILADIEEMSYREIADTLSIPTGTVMSRLHRGRSLLRSELAVYAESRGFGTTGNDSKCSTASEGGKSRAM